MILDDLEKLSKRKDVRSADRAAIRALLRKLRKKQPLDYQERLNLWAYLTRYAEK